MDNHLHPQGNALGFYGSDGTLWLQRDQSRTIDGVTERYWLFEAVGEAPRLFLLKEGADPDPSVPMLRSALADAVPAEKTIDTAQSVSDKSAPREGTKPPPANIDRLRRAIAGEFAPVRRRRQRKSDDGGGEK